ncbi:MAG: hypothetical protein ABI241_00625 [Bacteroidia bacterium]
MKGLAELIVEDFENNAPIPTNLEDWEKYSALIMLYLAAKKYIEEN